MQTQPLVVLLAEDDDGHAELVQRNLARSGIVNRIVRARDGQEALDYVFRRGAYAERSEPQQLLLLLDINMPRVDGVEVLTQIKGSEATASMPTIMLTTTDDPREIRRCYEKGCNVYVTKPVDYSAFVEAIRRLGLLLQIVKVPVDACMTGAGAQ